MLNFVLSPIFVRLKVKFLELKVKRGEKELEISYKLLRYAMCRVRGARN